MYVYGIWKHGRLPFMASVSAYANKPGHMRFSRYKQRNHASCGGSVIYSGESSQQAKCFWEYAVFSLLRNAQSCGRCSRRNSWLQSLPLLLRIFRPYFLSDDRMEKPLRCKKALWIRRLNKKPLSLFGESGFLFFRRFSCDFFAVLQPCRLFAVFLHKNSFRFLTEPAAGVTIKYILF